MFKDQPLSTKRSFPVALAILDAWLGELRRRADAGDMTHESHQNYRRHFVAFVSWVAIEQKLARLEGRNFVILDTDEAKWNKLEAAIASREDLFGAFVGSLADSNPGASVQWIRAVGSAVRQAFLWLQENALVSFDAKKLRLVLPTQKLPQRLPVVEEFLAERYASPPVRNTRRGHLLRFWKPIADQSGVALDAKKEAAAWELLKAGGTVNEEASPTVTAELVRRVNDYARAFRDKVLKEETPSSVKSKLSSVRTFLQWLQDRRVLKLESDALANGESVSPRVTQRAVVPKPSVRKPRPAPIASEVSAIAAPPVEVAAPMPVEAPIKEPVVPRQVVVTTPAVRPPVHVVRAKRVRRVVTSSPSARAFLRPRNQVVQKLLRSFGLSLRMVNDLLVAGLSSSGKELYIPDPSRESIKLGEEIETLLAEYASLVSESPYGAEWGSSSCPWLLLSGDGGSLVVNDNAEAERDPPARFVAARDEYVRLLVVEKEIPFGLLTQLRRTMASSDLRTIRFTHPRTKEHIEYVLSDAQHKVAREYGAWAREAFPHAWGAHVPDAPLILAEDGYMLTGDDA